MNTAIYLELNTVQLEVLIRVARSQEKYCTVGEALSLLCRNWENEERGAE